MEHPFHADLEYRIVINIRWYRDANGRSWSVKRSVTVGQRPLTDRPRSDRQFDRGLTADLTMA